MQTPVALVSIIIPTYNRALIVGETLESIRAQTHDHWECIIVDDGSTDHTLDVLNTYAAKDHRFKIYQRPRPLKKGAKQLQKLWI
ncbi:glycosyltransferase family 2 protein [Lacinutrix neustonica]|uniref:Glycosyltransferase family 2 protein n=1 Tax=Lacinutrix neustonica TaxID=2980107 RepID=A0A9E8MVQ4_9FLAO|nr:glycosyltransferase family 2 protein [Lacinutrix neustonica]WAC01936.1 glycosyltransferase family 2 protein [Lacinutrix neustonica]